MTDFHEDWQALPEPARNIHRALRSVIEELEAVDWYHQRAVLTADASLRAVIEHNRDEEIEHACMGLEWLRRNMTVWDDRLRTFLFTTAPITEIEETQEAEAVGAQEAGASRADLGIGRLVKGT